MFKKILNVFPLTIIMMRNKCSCGANPSVPDSILLPPQYGIRLEPTTQCPEAPWQSKFSKLPSKLKWVGYKMFVHLLNPDVDILKNFQYHAFPYD